MKKSCILLVFEPANSIYNYKAGHFYQRINKKHSIERKEDEKQINILKYWLL